MRKRSEATRRALQDDIEEIIQRDEVAQKDRDDLRDRVHAASRSLKEEIDRGSQPDLVDNLHAPVVTEVNPAVAKIVEKVFVEDPHAAYEKVEAFFTAADKQDPSPRLLEQSTTMAWLAYRVYATAKVERHCWELDNSVLFSVQRFAATRALQREKELDIRSKAITDADVVAKIAEMFHDEYRVQEMRRIRFKETESAMERFSEIAMVHCRTLQARASRGR